MKLSTFSGLAWLMLARGGLATVSFETCSALEATTCTCPTIKKCAPLQYNYPEDHFPRDGDTCSNSAPACCAERGDGPLRVTAADNLQCGKKIYIAPHIEITSDSCTAQGTKIPSNNNNWFMYSDLTFECAADACLRKCCCPAPALQ